MAEPLVGERMGRFPLATASTVQVRAYAELNDFLPASSRKVTFEHCVGPGATVEGLLTSLGIPTEVVDLSLVNGRPAAFGDPVRPGDRVALYPVFERFDVGGVQRLRETPLRSRAG